MESRHVVASMSKLGDILRPVATPDRSRLLHPHTDAQGKETWLQKGKASIQTACFPFLSGQQPCSLPLRVVFETHGATACTIRHDPDPRMTCKWLLHGCMDPSSGPAYCLILAGRSTPNSAVHLSTHLHIAHLISPMAGVYDGETKSRHVVLPPFPLH